MLTAMSAAEPNPCDRQRQQDDWSARSGHVEQLTPLLRVLPWQVIELSLVSLVCCGTMSEAILSGEDRSRGKELAAQLANNSRLTRDQAHAKLQRLLAEPGKAHSKAHRRLVRQSSYGTLPTRFHCLVIQGPQKAAGWCWRSHQQLVYRDRTGQPGWLP